MPFIDPNQIDLRRLRGNVGPTPEQQQRYRLENLLAQAQLENLQGQPGRQNRALDLEERGQNLTAKNAAITQELARLGITTQAETASKAQKGESDRAELASKTSTTNTLIGHLLNRPDIETDVVAETFRQRGAPEFANALDTAYAKKIETQVPKTLAEIQAVTDPKARATLVGEAFKDADTKKALLKLDPSLGTTSTEQTGPAAPPSETPGYNPEFGSNVRRAVTELPIYGSQLGAAIANTTVIPASNALASVFGLPPLQRARGATSYRDLLKR